MHRTIFLARISYPLLCSSLSPAECHQIESQPLSALRQKLSLPRTFPKALLVGPKSRLCMGIPSVESVQGSEKVLKIIAHMRMRSQLADSITNMLNWYQLATGREEHCLQLCCLSPYVFLPWISSLIKFLRKSDLHLRIPHLWRPSKLRAHDASVMDSIPDSVPTLTKRDIDACRTYLQISMLSEITSLDGLRIPASVFRGSPPFLRQVKGHP